MKIYFFLKPYKSPTQANYQHQCIALAEGFSMMPNVEFLANIDYWLIPGDGTYLFQKSKYVKSDIVIYSALYVLSKDFQLDFSAVNVLIDNMDGNNTLAKQCSFKNFDLILRSHYNNYEKQTYLENVVPWAFGLTNRIISSIDDVKNIDMKPTLLQTYRVAHNVRKFYSDLLKSHMSLLEFISDPMNKTEEKRDLRMSFWSQTGRRHNPDYYRQISNVQFLLSFGGAFEEKNLVKKYLAKVQRKLKLNDRNNYYIIQWDSWRFWEGLYSNCVPIHIRLEDFGCLLPEMPLAETHYLGVRNRRYTDQIKEISKMTLKESCVIAKTGKEWVEKHYSPLPTSKRLLNLISKN